MAPNTYPVWSYLVYMAVSMAVTVGVARTLHRNGRIFLVDAFRGDEAVADSVNHLLLVGFYLVNLGFVSLYLKDEVKPVGLETAIEILSGKIGFVLLVLGAMHFMNMYVFSRVRRRTQQEETPSLGTDTTRTR